MNDQNIYNNLISIAASLLRCTNLSEYKEDNPKSTPISVLRKIEKHNDWLKEIAVQLKNIACELKWNHPYVNLLERTENESRNK